MILADEWRGPVILAPAVVGLVAYALWRAWSDSRREDRERRYPVIRQLRESDELWRHQHGYDKRIR